MAARGDWAPSFKACHDPPVAFAGPTCYELEWAERGALHAMKHVDTARTEAADAESADADGDDEAAGYDPEAQEVPEEAGIVTCVDCRGDFEPAAALIWRGDDRVYCRECFAEY